MKKKRFSVEQIVGVLKQADVGVPVGRVGPEGGDIGANLLAVEEAIRWIGDRPSSATEAAYRRRTKG